MVGSLQSAAEFNFRHDEERGRTILSHRQAGGLCHLSKPYWDGSVLGAQILNPTAGFFSGDEMTMSVRLEEKAKVAVTSPSATRFYAMESGRAVLKQEFHLGKGSWLEYRPDWVIPQSGSTVRQITRLNLEKGAQTIFFDRLAPGRVAHGESYRYDHYGTLFELRYDNELIARERMSLTPESGGWPLTVSGWEVTYYGAVWVVGDLENGVLETLSEFEQSEWGEEVKVGMTRLAPNVAVLRILTARSLLLKNVLSEVREALIPYFPLLEGGRRTL